MPSTILIVDDHEAVRSALRNWLIEKFPSFRIMEMTSGEEAIAKIKEVSPHLIIMDFKLPGMDGLALLKRIQDSHLDAMKILITAYRSEVVISEAINMGVKEIIEKPFTSKIIEATLSRLIEAR